MTDDDKKLTTYSSWVPTITSITGSVRALRVITSAYANPYSLLPKFDKSQFWPQQGFNASVSASINVSFTPDKKDVSGPDVHHKKKITELEKEVGFLKSQMFRYFRDAGSES